MAETDAGHPMRRATDAGNSPADKPALSIRVLNMVVISVAVALVLVGVFVAGRLLDALMDVGAAGENYTDAIEAANELQTASDFLTNEVRMFVLTGDAEHVRAFVDEVEVDDRRGRAVDALRECCADDVEAIAALEGALTSSNELAQRELYAMKLASLAYGAADVPASVRNVRLDASDARLSDGEKLDLAREMVVGDEYVAKKTEINTQVDECLDVLLAGVETEQDRSDERMNMLVVIMQAVVALMLAVLVLVIVAIMKLVLSPLANYVGRINRGLELQPQGAYELRYLAEAYNSMYEENVLRTEHLRHAAEHDPLTGLFNRGAYDELLAESDSNVALLLIDVDKFKECNDTYGHDTGDAVLKKVASSIMHAFRLTDHSCRIGGDEFCVIMTDVDPSLRGVIATKIKNVAAALVDTSDGLPPTTLSIGVAFGVDHATKDDLYRAADRALYQVKERGRNGFAFYGDE